jgi:hypothetical protein
MPPVEFEPTISAGERPQSYALDRAATGTGYNRVLLFIISNEAAGSGGSGWFSRNIDSLRAGRSGDRILVGAKFSAPVQTGPGVHTASLYSGYRSYYPWVKLRRRGADHPPLLAPRLKKE